MTLIKNCGLKSPEEIAQAASTGASFVGFIHHPSSPRHLAIEDIAPLLAYAKPRLKSVVVLANPDDEILYDVAELLQPDYLQLHSVRDIRRIAHITQTLGVPVITAIAVESAADLITAAAIEEVSTHLLFDAKTPGSGQAFDWTMLRDTLRGISLAKPWFLAGGLNAGNVVEAMRITHAPMVDVSSGLESSLGIKSLEKIAAFNAAVLHAKT